eukprot:TRINITY_DN24147_c0_g1_i4.p1 TRINITY_DN24147_c0_g1~~TRINITY_DN24147_c0_g1_i4.p1  ORF type:complete len:464 (+),score=125.40 TRINITY_DN24147_c0_g1_i4:80-1471(+)
MLRSLVGSEMCIRDRSTGTHHMGNATSGQLPEDLTPRALTILRWLEYDAPPGHVLGVLHGLSKNLEEMQEAPDGIDEFEFEMQEFVPVIQACLAMDGALGRAQLELVRPGRMTEDVFWRYYMFHLEFVVNHSTTSDQTRPPEKEMTAVASSKGSEQSSAPAADDVVAQAASEPDKDQSEIDTSAYTFQEGDFVVFGPRPVHGFVKLPTARFSGYAANDWGVDKCDMMLDLRLIAHGYHGASIVLETQDSHSDGKKLFGICPLNLENVWESVEPVIDSSRYFVLRLVARINGTAKTGFVGVGYEQRDTSFCFKYELQRVVRMADAAVEDGCPSDEEKEYICKNSPDLSHLKLKEGEVIQAKFKLNLSSSKKKSSRDNSEIPQLGGGRKRLLKPREKKLVASKPAANDFGEFQDGFDTGQDFAQFEEMSAFDNTDHVHASDCNVSAAAKCDDADDPPSENIESRA